MNFLIFEILLQLLQFYILVKEITVRSYKFTHGSYFNMPQCDVVEQLLNALCISSPSCTLFVKQWDL